jgi:hypothetical protein
MSTQRKHIRIVVAVFAMFGLALASSSSGEAKSRIPAPKQPAAVRLVQVNSGWCGGETFAVIVNGRRGALAC